MTVCSIALLAACGGGGEDGGEEPTAVTGTALEAPDQPGGTLDRAALIEAADANCDYQDKTLARFGPAGKTVTGIAEQWAGSTPALQEVQDLQSALEPDEAVAATWDDYLKASQAYIDSGTDLGAVTDDAGFATASAALSKALQATYAPADKLGLKVCTHTPEPTVEETEMVNPATFDLAEPSNTVEEAADTFIKAVDSKDCARINAQVNSDNGELAADNCEYLVNAYSGTEVVGTQSFGPLAVAEFSSATEAKNGTVKFIIDTDGVLRFAGESVILGGGINPPSEGFDSQESMDAALTSIRDQNGEGFLAIQGPDSSVTEVDDPFVAVGTGPGAEKAATDIRENPDVDAVMIGANQAGGYFIFDTEGDDYLLENGHNPGSETSYGNFGYWLLPAP